MHPGTDHSRLAALTATLKVLARWSPHARHDLVGACSPISLDLSLLDVKSRRASLSVEDIGAFIKRSKENVRNTVQEIDAVMLLHRQDRDQRVAVSDMMEKMERSIHTLFARVNWTPPADPASLGEDAEYDLTMVIWAALMALLDHCGARMQLTLAAQRQQGLLILDFSVAPADDTDWTDPAGDVAPHHRIAIDEVKHLATHLGFEFAEREGGITLRRASANVPVSTGS